MGDLRLRWGQLLSSHFFMHNPEIEYNLAGGLLLTVGTGDFDRLLDGVDEAGYDGVCVLPFRALMKEGGFERLENSGLQVNHVEETWNPTTFDNLWLAIGSGLGGHIRRGLRDRSEPPILQDALFPSKETGAVLFDRLLDTFKDLKFISHRVLDDFNNARWLLEINPGLGKSADEILRIGEERGVNLVFDPTHLLPNDVSVSFPGESTHEVSGAWESQFMFFRDRLEVVDVHGSVSELTYHKGGLRELVAAAKEAPAVKYLRVEMPIPLRYQVPGIPLAQLGGLKYLEDLHQAISEI